MGATCPGRPRERRPSHRDGVTAVPDVCSRRRKGEPGFGPDSVPSATWRAPARVQEAGWRRHREPASRPSALPALLSGTFRSQRSTKPCHGTPPRAGRERRRGGAERLRTWVRGPTRGSHHVRAHRTTRLGATKLGPTKPLGQVPPKLLGWVPPGRVPPRCRVGCHWTGYHQATSVGSHQVKSQQVTKLGMTRSGRTKPRGWVPLHQVPPGQVPPGHQVGSHQVGSHHATRSGMTGSCPKALRWVPGAQLPPRHGVGSHQATISDPPKPRGRVPPHWVPGAQLPPSHNPHPAGRQQPLRAGAQHLRHPPSTSFPLLPPTRCTRSVAPNTRGEPRAEHAGAATVWPRGRGAEVASPGGRGLPPGRGNVPGPRCSAASPRPPRRLAPVRAPQGGGVRVRTPPSPLRATV